MADPPAPDSLQREWPGVRSGTETAASGDVKFPAEDGGKSLAEMAQRDLVATLQLLTERAQYITGATGAAIALRDGTEMTCRASAGTSAPEVGAQLQVDSGLSGESVRTQQTLRCDDASVDPRVNRESCEALGIASVVVMPLVQGSEVIGVFELFSDKAHAFEARDITALERMGAMVFTALENALAALKDVASAAVAAPQHPEVAVENASPSAPASMASDAAEKDANADSEISATPSPEQTVTAAPDVSVSDGPVIVPGSAGFTFHAHQHASVNTAPAAEVPSEASRQDDVANILEEPAGPVLIPGVKQSAAPQNPQDAASSVEADILESDASAPKAEADPAPSPVPEEAVEAALATPAQAATAPGEPPSEVAGLRRCEHCGFPVSEGRLLCLDCERKAAATASAEPKAAPNPVPDRPFQNLVNRQNAVSPPAAISTPAPAFLPEPDETSWLAKHKLLVISAAIVIAATVAFWLLR